MAAISTWSKTAASNNSTSPDGWPEGMNPSGVNDSAREMMSALRTRFEQLEWFDHGHVLVRQSANSFLVSSTATQIYTAGRRVKLYDTTTIYGDVIASSPSGANTLVTVSSSALTASLSSGEVGIIDPANRSLPTVTEVSLAGQHLTAGTQISLTSTSVNFTSIPSWVKRITVMVEGMSTNGTSVPIVQIGDAGGIETTTYVSNGLRMDVVNAAQTTGYALSGSWAASLVAEGQIVLTLKNSANNTWTMTSQLTGAAEFYLGAGNKALSAALDRIRLTMVNGTDTFDAGSVNILYE